MESVLDESRRNERYYEKKYRDQTYEYMNIRKRLHWMENKEATQAREDQAKKQKRYEELQEESRIRVRAEMEERHRI